MEPEDDEMEYKAEDMEEPIEVDDDIDDEEDEVGGGPEKGTKFQVFTRPISVGIHPSDTRWNRLSPDSESPEYYDLTQISKRVPPLVIFCFFCFYCHFGPFTPFWYTCLQIQLFWSPPPKKSGPPPGRALNLSQNHF